MFKSPAMNKPPDLRHPGSRLYVLPLQKRKVNNPSCLFIKRPGRKFEFSRAFISKLIVTFSRNQALSHCAWQKNISVRGPDEFFYWVLSLLRALLNFKPMQQLNQASFSCKQTSCVSYATSHTFILLHILSDMCSTNHSEKSPQSFATIFSRQL